VAGETILVVDDSTEACDFAVNYVLRPNGYRPLVAHDGEKGLHRAIDENPDLIILDLEMPKMTGMEVLEALNEAGHSIPVILSTLHGSEGMAVRAFRLGVKDYIAKPYRVEEMLTAIERALSEVRLRRERDQLTANLVQRVREQTILYSIGQAVTSSLDLQQVLNRLVEAAVFITRAHGGSLLLVEDGTEHLVLRAIQKPGEKQAHSANQTVKDPIAQQVLRSGKSVPHSPAAGQAAAPRLCIPLSVKQKPIGVLRVERQPGEQPFTQNHVSLLVALADYAAVALENARLYARVEQELADRTTLYRISSALAASIDLQDILQIVLEEAVHTTRAERGYILLRDVPHGSLQVRYAHNLDQEAIASESFEISRSIVERVARDGEPVLTVNAREDPRFAESKSVIAYSLRSILCVPITGGEGTEGVIYVDNHVRTGQFTARHQELLIAIAAQAATAIRNARLFAEVEAERSKLEAVLRGSANAVIVTDQNDRVLLFNETARQAFGIGGRGTGILLPEAVDNPNLLSLIQHAADSGQAQWAEVTLDDGRTMSVDVTPIADVGRVAVMQDITHLKELNQMKSEFVANVSHDLRSPLSSVLSLLAVLHQVGPLTPKQEEFIGSARQHLTHLLQLTDELLDLARLEAGVDLTMVPCDLAEIVQESVKGLQAQAGDKGQYLSVSIDPNLPLVQGNSLRLSQVINNLVGNAVKYTPPGGAIAVKLEEATDELLLHVQDNGIGISPADQPYIFDKFYQAKDKSTSDASGVGLGLAIAKSAVEKHGGRIWVESEQGHGTTFHVALPALRE
jgi:signal transduction histidine kinase/DNA-binding response OmpR family regulator